MNLVNTLQNFNILILWGNTLKQTLKMKMVCKKQL